MKKRHNFLFSLCLLAIVNLSFAQDSLRQKHLILKIAPLTMFDIDNTFQLAIEHRLAKNSRWTLSEEFGYGTGNAQVWRQLNYYGPFRENYRARIEARRYRKDKPLFTGVYTAYELFYKQINDRISRNAGRECESGNCNYFEKIDYGASKYVLGGNIKIGSQVRIRNEMKNKSNFIFDFYVGLGLRMKMIDHEYDEFIGNDTWVFGNSASIYSSSDFGYKDRTYVIPNIAFGIKLGYIVF
jgi:hypothetical protein